jgi:peroxiredoxin
VIQLLRHGRRLSGRPGPDFTLPAADREGSVSLADYRGRSPLLLGLFRGTYCPFCRRAIIRMGQAWQRLRGENEEAFAVVATAAENARFHFRHRPQMFPVAADPDFVTHRLYGVPAPLRADIADAFRTTRINPCGGAAHVAADSRGLGFAEPAGGF